MEWDYKPTIFHEPNCPKTYTPWPANYVFNGYKRGCVANWFNAAKQLLLVDYTTQWIMICEDDIDWYVGSARLVRSRLIHGPSFGFLSPYCSEHNGYSAVRGVWMPPRLNKPSAWCGACCLIFERAVLNEIVQREEQFFEFSRDQHTGDFVHLDAAISEIIHVLKLPLDVHMPSLVKHCGDVSTIETNNTSVARSSRSRQTLQ